MRLRATPAIIGLVLAAATSLSAESAAPGRRADEARDRPAGAPGSLKGPGESSDEALPPLPNVLVQVGGSCITSYGIKREVSIQMRGREALRRNLVEAGSWTEDHEAKFASLRAELAVKWRDGLVAQALMAELAREVGYKPNERRLERRLRTVIKKAGGIEALLRKEGRSLDGIRGQLRLQDLQRRFFRNLIPQVLGPGPREIRRRYEANRSALKAPPRVRVRIIFISSGSDPKAAFTRADDLRRELRFAPGRFEERAREVSTHKETAERGGLFVEEVGGKRTDWIPFDVLARNEPAIAAAVRQLSPGKVSTVVRVGKGFLLVKLDGYRKGRELALAEASDRITKALAREKEDRLIEDWMDYYLERTYLVDGEGRRVRHRPGPEAP